MTCTAILAEVSSNNNQITELGSQKGAKVAQNVAAGVVGLVVWPVWFLMDFQGAAGTEIKALQDRNAYLATKANAMDCGKEPQTQVVKRDAPAPAPAYAGPPSLYAAPAPTYASPATMTPAYAAPAQPAYAPAPQPAYSTYPAHNVPVSTAPTHAYTQGGTVQPAAVAAPRYPTSTVEASGADPYAIDPYPTTLVPSGSNTQTTTPPTY